MLPECPVGRRLRCGTVAQATVIPCSKPCALVSFSSRIPLPARGAQGSPTLPHRSGPAHPGLRAWDHRGLCHGSATEATSHRALGEHRDLLHDARRCVATSFRPFDRDDEGHRPHPRSPPRNRGTGHGDPMREAQGEPDPIDAAGWANPGYGGGSRRNGARYQSLWVAAERKGLVADS